MKDKTINQDSFGFVDLSEFALDLQKQMIHRLDRSRESAMVGIFDQIFRIAKSIQIDAAAEAKAFELKNHDNIRLKDDGVNLREIE